MKRTTLAAAVLAAVSAIGAGTASAQQRAIVITEAPPAPRYEVAPDPRPGRVWVEGHYAWRNGEYTWVQGHWQRAQRDMVWRQAEWVQRPDGSWVFREGRWVPDRRGNAYGNRHRDNDGDGVANRFDRYPWDSERS